MNGYFYFDPDGRFASESSVFSELPEGWTVREIGKDDYAAFKSGEKVWDGKGLSVPPPPAPPTDLEVALEKIDVLAEKLRVEAESDPVGVIGKVDAVDVALVEAVK